MNLPKLNDKLINRVIEHITKYPESYNQNDTARSCEVSKKVPCGAIGCFGGWAVLLSIPKNERFERAQEEEHDTNILYEAGDLLGLTDYEQDFLFDAATGHPKQDLKIIKERVAEIRRVREVLSEFEGFARVKVQTKHDGVVELEYGY